jgi:hypothetical protein
MPIYCECFRCSMMGKAHCVGAGAPLGSGDGGEALVEGWLVALAAASGAWLAPAFDPGSAGPGRSGAPLPLLEGRA